MKRKRCSSRNHNTDDDDKDDKDKNKNGNSTIKKRNDKNNKYHHPLIVHPLNISIIPQAKQRPIKLSSCHKQGKDTNGKDQCQRQHRRTTLLQCWAHTQKGNRCTNKLPSTREGEPIPIPYCTIHLKSGDGCVKVVNHPFASKCLVARYDIPKNYRFAFWGKRGKCPPCHKDDRAIAFYPPNPKTGSNKCIKRNTSARTSPTTNTNKTNNYNGVLNPTNTGDVIQYAACPGPNERQNIKSTFHYWGKRNGQFGGLEFVTIQEIPRNTQLCHWYGPNWWSSRSDSKRRDVGIAQYPAPRRQLKVRHEL